MPVIVAANPKGGSGKSTTCIVLATTLAAQGATVRVIDADPQRTLARWAEGSSKFKGLVVVPEREEHLTLLIDRLQSQYQFVVIDVQGTANMEMAEAMSRADLVLIPMQGKTADADVATRAVSLVRNQEHVYKHPIPHAILFMRTSAMLQTREEQEIRKNVIAAGIPTLKASLNERTAFSHIFAYKCSLGELNTRDTSKLAEAQENAIRVTAEVVTLLRQKKESAA